MWFSFYSLADGTFTGAGAFLQPYTSEKLAEITPDGCGAAAGQHDHQRMRFDLDSGQVVDRQPPAPPDSILVSWCWEEGRREWIATPTHHALALEAKAQRARRLAGSDWIVARSVELAVPVPPEWTKYRQALRDITSQTNFPRVVVWPEPPA